MSLARYRRVSPLEADALQPDRASHRSYRLVCIHGERVCRFDYQLHSLLPTEVDHLSLAHPSLQQGAMVQPHILRFALGTVDKWLAGLLTNLYRLQPFCRASDD